MHDKRKYNTKRNGNCKTPKPGEIYNASLTYLKALQLKTSHHIHYTGLKNRVGMFENYTN